MKRGLSYIAVVFFTVAALQAWDHASELRLFRFLASGNPTPEKLCTRTTTLMGGARREIMRGRPRPHLWLRSVSDEIMSGGACADFRKVYMALCYASNIKVRPYSMRTDGSVHHVVEVEHEGKWVAVDPAYGIVWPASAESLYNGWIGGYEEKAPEGYNQAYRYERLYPGSPFALGGRLGAYFMVHRHSLFMIMFLVSGTLCLAVKKLLIKE